MSLTQPNRPAYDAIADWYAEWVDRESWAHPTLLRRLLPLTGDVSGSRVADIGCGEGWFSRVLARAGATVVGIDISEAMLERARARTDGGMAITYVRDDAQVLGTIGDNECDGAISMLALMDIPDLAATFRAIHRAVVHGGWLVIGITHPCFYGPQASWSDDERRTHAWSRPISPRGAGCRRTPLASAPGSARGTEPSAPISTLLERQAGSWRRCWSRRT